MNWRAYLSFFAVVILWASTPVAVDHLLEEKGLSVLTVLATTAVFAAMALLIGAATMGRLQVVRKWKGRDWAIVIGMGMLGIVGYTSFYYLAFYLAPPDEVNVVNYLWPLFLVLFARPVLGERHDWWTWPAIALGFVGAAGIVSQWRLGFLIEWKFVPPWPSRFGGYYSAIAGAVCWALFSALGKRLSYDKVTAMAFYCLTGAVVFSAALLFVGVEVRPDGFDWLLLLYLGAAVNGIAYALWFMALTKGPTALFANLVFITPFLALIYLWIFDVEPLRPGVWAAAALIVAGALLAVNRASRKGPIVPSRVVADDRRAPNRQV